MPGPGLVLIVSCGMHSPGSPCSQVLCLQGLAPPTDLPPLQPETLSHAWNNGRKGPTPTLTLLPALCRECWNQAHLLFASLDYTFPEGLSSSGLFAPQTPETRSTRFIGEGNEYKNAGLGHQAQSRFCPLSPPISPILVSLCVLV